MGVCVASARSFISGKSELKLVTPAPQQLQLEVPEKMLDSGAPGSAALIKTAEQFQPYLRKNSAHRIKARNSVN